MESLPNELLVCIGKYAQEDDFPAMSLCSKRLRAVYLPFLISSFLLRHGGGFSLGYILLIMRIWRQPELAYYVRHFELTWLSYDNYFDEDFHLGEQFSEFIDDALDEIFDPEEQACRLKWKKHLHAPCVEAWKGLLLVRLTRLESIKITHEWSESLVPTILHKAAHRQRPFHEALPFRYLHHVQASPQCGPAAIDTGFILPFFYFPAVSTIQTDNTGEGGMRENVCEVESAAIHRKGIEEMPSLLPVDCHSSRPVHTVTALSCSHNRGLFEWLAACSQLERLDIELSVFRYDSGTEDWYQFSAPEFRQALLPFQATLQKLHLRADYNLREYDGRELIDFSGPVGSLREFTVLQDLRLRHAHLLPLSSASDTTVGGGKQQLLDILPTSIRSLGIVDILQNDLPDLLLELLGLVRQQTSSSRPFHGLERIELYVGRGSEEGLLDLLRPSCEAAAIVLTVESTYY